MSDPMDTALAGVALIAGAVWSGGLVAIFVVARVATGTMPRQVRVAFFRGLGRAYGIVGGVALVVALAAGAALLRDQPWSGLLTGTIATAAALIVVTVIGVVQARRMTRLRRAALRESGDARLAGRIRNGARSATVLRAAIAALTLALLILAAVLTTQPH